MAKRMAGRASGMGSYAVTASVSAAEIAALKRAIQRAGKEARREMRHQLKAVGEIVQQSIQGMTPVHGGGSYGTGKSRRRVGVDWAGKSYRQSHAPGLLRKSTRLKIGRASVTVYNDAKAVSRSYPGGYRYGKRLEFDVGTYGRGGTLQNGTAVTPYAFFYPGFEAVKDQAKEKFENVLRSARRAFLRG